MKRRLVVVLGLATGCSCLGLTGCVSSGLGALRREARAASEEPPASASAPDEPESSAPKGFFKPTRRPAALSDEGAEVERNLGLR